MGDPGTMRTRFVQVVDDLLATDPRAVVVLAVISRSLFADYGVLDRHPDRVIDVGIREQAQIGVAGGLSLEGFVPIVTGYAPFLVERTFEQVKLSITHQGARAILVSVGATWDSAGSGRTHQAPEDVALMRTLPDWDIHVPGHPDEVGMLLRHAHAGDRSAYIRTSGDMNREAFSTVPGEVVTLREGSDGSPTVLAVGPVADAVLAAVADLDVTVAYTATPSPLDGAGLRATVTGDDLLLVEPYLSGTSLPQVADVFADRRMRLRHHGVRTPEVRAYGRPDDHRRFHGLDAAGIRAALLKGTPVAVA